MAPSAQRRKVWLTPTTRVPCSNAENIGERKTWTQSELRAYGVEMSIPFFWECSVVWAYQTMFLRLMRKIKSAVNTTQNAHKTSIFKRRLDVTCTWGRWTAEPLDATDNRRKTTSVWSEQLAQLRLLRYNDSYVHVYKQ